MNHEWTKDLAAPGTLEVLCSDTDEFITNVSIIYNIIFIKINLRFKRKLIINYIKN